MQSVDLLAGQAHRQVVNVERPPRILVFDSGLGGLTVFRELVKARPDASFIYVADDAAFPYGTWAEDALRQRLLSVMDGLVAKHRPDCVVIACNTASTLVLPALRQAHALPFVGTVPAVKPAAEMSRSGMVSILATPGTVARDYTRTLIERFAGTCLVTMVGSARLASLAEADMRGEVVDDSDILAEIIPCFVESEIRGARRRTDVVTLSCTHYPLLLDRFRRLAPWPVTWIDPAPAIARRMLQIVGPVPANAWQGKASEGEASASFTSGEPALRLRETLSRFGIDDVMAGPR